MTAMQRSLMLLAAAFFVMVAFQSYELLREYGNLENAQGAQQAPLEQAAQMRQETEAFAGDVAVLADKGNADAKQIVDAMRAQGITLRAPQAGQATVAPATPPAK